VTARCAALLLLLGWFMAGQAAAEADGFRVLRAELIQRDASWELNADLDYRFSDAVIDALRNGVSLTLELRLQVLRERAWLWNETVLDARRRVTVRYHSLTKLYQLTVENTDTPSNFASLGALLENLGTVRALKMAPADRLPTGARYRAKMAVKLDIESLPLPLRPIAYLTPAWRLSSPWFRWSFVN
jgi:hypothetical protein